MNRSAQLALLALVIGVIVAVVLSRPADNLVLAQKQHELQACRDKAKRENADPAKRCWYQEAQVDEQSKREMERVRMP